MGRSLAWSRRPEMKPSPKDERLGGGLERIHAENPEDSLLCP